MPCAVLDTGEADVTRIRRALEADISHCLHRVAEKTEVSWEGSRIRYLSVIPSPSWLPGGCICSQRACALSCPQVSETASRFPHRSPFLLQLCRCVPVWCSWVVPVQDTPRARAGSHSQEGTLAIFADTLPQSFSLHLASFCPLGTALLG